MVSTLFPGLNGLGSTPSQGHCVVFLDKRLNSQSVSPPRPTNAIQAERGIEIFPVA